MSRWIMSKEIESVNKVSQYWKAQDKLASLVILPTIKRRINVNSFQTLPKIWREVIILKFIYDTCIFPDIKVR